MKKKILFTMALATLTANAQLSDVEVKQDTYGHDYASLSAWECPEWFKDAKFGIWAHWGPQCQPEDGDWYARFMYYAGSNQYNYHVSHYGNPSVFGMKDVCNAWKAEAWNPQELVNLYKSVGARYFMALANHHDNLDLWDSPYQEWNTMNVGPHKDIIGGWKEACDAAGLPLCISIHASHAWTWYEPSQNYDGNLTLEDGFTPNADGTEKWWKGLDPQELYAQRHSHSSGWESSGTIHSQWNWGNGASQPSATYKRKFQNRVLQCIDAYDPAMIYFDDTAMPFYGCDDEVGKNILQHYYNHSAAQHGGKAEVIATGKQLTDAQKDYMMWDVERGIPDRPQAQYWQTCTCIGDWHYNQSTYNNNKYKSAATVVRMLVDIVSKNGNLLLNIPMRGNGSIDEKERAVLAGIKAWMDINSESIYGTRMWTTFGEGPLAEAANPMNAQGFNEGLNYSSKDVRYVEKDGRVYATIMAWPTASTFTLKAFGLLSDKYSGKVESVKLLGYGDVAFTQDVQGLNVEIPSIHPNEIAPVFCITITNDESTLCERLLQTKQQLSQLVIDMQDKTCRLNTGKPNAEALEELATALATIDVSPSSSNETLAEASKALTIAYAKYQSNRLNVGGTMVGRVEENLTTQYLIEASDFSRAEGGSARFGKPTHWTVENFVIPNGSDGTKQGLDRYNGKEALMLGVWDDAQQSIGGDLTNARIYRKVTLPAGDYYFGAAMNANYQLSEQALMFVSTALYDSPQLADKSIASYPIGMCGKDLMTQGLYFTLAQPTEVYIGFQANLALGSSTQEFRVQTVSLYRISTDVTPLDPIEGWTPVEDILPDDLGRYFFTLTDVATQLGLQLQQGEHQAKKTMVYKADTRPTEQKAAVWEILPFDNNNWSCATSVNATKVLLANVEEPNSFLHSEDKQAWWYRISNNGEGWPDRGYLLPRYEAAQGGWTLQNYKGGGYVGPWADVFADGADVASNKGGAQTGYFQMGAITRGQYMALAEDLSSASPSHPLDVTYLLTNPSVEMYNMFHDYNNPTPIGWNLEGDVRLEGSGWLPRCDGKWYVNHWQSSGNLADRKMWQTLYDLPTGAYRLSVFTSCTGKNAFLFAGDARAQFNSKDGSGVVAVDAEVTDGMLTLGAALDGFVGNDCKYDNFRLSYLGRYEAMLRIGETGYGTFCAPFDVALPEGVEAYSVVGATDGGESYRLVLSGVEGVVPAHTPVIVKGQPMERSFVGMPTSEASCTSPFLTGVFSEGEAPVGSYVLQNLGGHLGFYPVAEGRQPTLKQSRCYLTLPVGMEAKAAFLFDEATAVGRLVPSGVSSGRIYDLSGRPASARQKGVRIVGGKKIVGD